ncbi:MAG: hypothetical protein AB1792_02230 [Candidatus Zixiibacteriota bacterium]
MKRTSTIVSVMLLATFTPLSAYGIEVRAKAASKPVADSSGTIPQGGVVPGPQDTGRQAGSASTPEGMAKPTEEASRERSSKNTLLERLKRTVREAQKKETQPQYDHLIDDNNDGVDDRIEKPPTTKSTAKKPATTKRKPRTDSTRKTPPK